MGRAERRVTEGAEGGREVAEVALDLNCLLMFSVLPCWAGKAGKIYLRTTCPASSSQSCPFRVAVEVVFQVEEGE